MSKNTVIFSVDADTSKVRVKLDKVKKEIQATQNGITPKALSNGFKGVDTAATNTTGTLGKLSNTLKNIGAGNPLSSVTSAIGDMSGLLKGMGGAFTPITAGVAAMGFLKNEVDKLVESGREAQNTFEKWGTQIGTVSGNLTGNNNVSALIKDIQLMSANGVNSVDDLAQASQTLLVATGGSQGAVKEWLPLLDDLAAGTGKSAAEWASMAAEVKLTGVSTKDLTKLSNQGIPIYQAFAKVLGTTADEAEALAKAGKITTEQWNDAVKELATTYKGLSANLSNNTAQGAKDTMEAVKALKDAAATRGYDAVRKGYYQQKTEEYNSKLNNADFQARTEWAGSKSAQWDNMVDRVKDAFTEDLPQAFGSFLSAVGLIDDELEARKKNALTRTRNGVVEAVNAAVKSGDYEQGTSEQRQAMADNIAEALKVYRDNTPKESIDPHIIGRAEAEIERLREASKKLAEKEKQQAIDEYGNSIKKKNVDEKAKDLGYIDWQTLKSKGESAYSDLTSGKGTEEAKKVYQDYISLLDEANKEQEQLNKQKKAEREAKEKAENARLNNATSSEQVRDIVERYVIGSNKSDKAIRGQRDALINDLATGEEKDTPEAKHALEVLNKFISILDKEAEDTEKAAKAKADALETELKATQQTEDKRLSMATNADQIKDLVEKYIGYEATDKQISDRVKDLKNGMADGSIVATEANTRELAILSQYIKLQTEATEKEIEAYNNSAEGKEAQAEAEKAEKQKRQEMLNESAKAKTLQDGQNYWKNRLRGTKEGNEIDKEARSLTQLQRTRFNKSKAEKDADYESKWKEAQALKKAGIKDLNSVRDYKSAEAQQEQARTEELATLKAIETNLEKMQPYYN